MPAQVTYWTGTWDPNKEGISKEVQALRRSRSRPSIVVAFSPAHRTRFDRKHRAIVLSANRWLTLRAIAAALEPVGDVSHVFGGFTSWHLLRALGRRPIVLTAVAFRNGAPPALPGSIARVAVEAEGLVREWKDAGVPADRIRVVYPGLDLSYHAPLPLPTSARLQLLFASSPASADEFHERGIPLLIELARVKPDIDITVPWRQWGDVSDTKRAIEALQPPPNFHVQHDASADMRSYLAKAHATITLFATAAGKACPNSVIEGLASGRPAVTTWECGISDLLHRTGAGVVSERTVPAISDAIDRLRTAIPSLHERARHAAETYFEFGRFTREYETLYQEVTTPA